MSDRTGKPVSGWTDRELDATYPPGRNAGGFRQKMLALKRELKNELGGGSVDASPRKKAGDAAPKMKAGRKRKAASDEEETPKKRRMGKTTKSAVEEDVEESESLVKEGSEEEISSSA
ncbi:hypothetical protein DE146DRAFT_751911 [Phaeosphaeria sp. MPI-PUGE-AT-0046c]|nr:hypothetical protein DE146DRAFT_751911 [Phaeosphaeria sp. MPI-PUGE-AT-0046c]